MRKASQRVSPTEISLDGPVRPTVTPPAPRLFGRIVLTFVFVTGALILGTLLLWHPGALTIVARAFGNF